MAATFLAAAVVGVTATTVGSTATAAPTRTSSTTVLDPGQGGPAPVGLPVVFRQGPNRYALVFRLSSTPARVGGSAYTSGELNRYAQDAGAGLTFLHRNAKARCFLMTYSAELSRREGGPPRWPGSRPALGRGGTRERVSVVLTARSPGADPRDERTAVPGPTVRFDGIKVHDPGRPLVSVLDVPALDNRNAQRILRSIGCDGRIATGLAQFTGHDPDAPYD